MSEFHTFLLCVWHECIQMIVLIHCRVYLKVSCYGATAFFAYSNCVVVVVAGWYPLQYLCDFVSELFMNAFDGILSSISVLSLWNAF